MEVKVTEKTYPVQIKWLFVLPIYGLFMSPFVITSMTSSGMYLFSLKGAIVTYYFIHLPACVIYLALKRANFHYSLEDEYLLVKQGLFKKSQVKIPYNIMKKVYIRDNLVNRWFGLQWLSVDFTSDKVGDYRYTKGRFILMPMMGTNVDMFRVSGLTREHAQQLLNIIEQKIRAHQQAPVPGV